MMEFGVKQVFSGLFMRCLADVLANCSAAGFTDSMCRLESRINAGRGNVSHSISKVRVAVMALVLAGDVGEGKGQG